jgi:DNA-binding FadR family transcriptional regulator
VAEAVAGEIVRDIRRQDLVGGAKLPPESAMMERYRIGRGSLREALRILEVNGLVTLKSGPGGGPVVAAHDPTNFGHMSTLHLQALGATYRQLLEARVEYEAMLARMAAERAGDEAAQAVRKAMDVGKNMLSDDSEYLTTGEGFHTAVCDSSGNPVLALVANSVQAIWSIRVAPVLFPPESRPLVIQQHEAITRAIEKHEATRTERLMREHVLLYLRYCEERYPARMDDVVEWS